MGNYLQKPFDIAFVKAIEHLYETRAVHGKFTKRKELLTELGIADSNYISIRAGERGVPRDKYDSIANYLSDQYFIDPDFLFGRSQVMVKRNVRVLRDGPGADQPESIERYKEEIRGLKALIEEKERFIQFQQKSIDMLNNLLSQGGAGLFNKQ